MHGSWPELGRQRRLPGSGRVNTQNAWTATAMPPCRSGWYSLSACVYACCAGVAAGATLPPGKRALFIPGRPKCADRGAHCAACLEDACLQRFAAHTAVRLRLSACGSCPRNARLALPSPALPCLCCVPQASWRCRRAAAPAGRWTWTRGMAGTPAGTGSWWAHVAARRSG